MKMQRILIAIWLVLASATLFAEQVNYTVYLKVSNCSGNYTPGIIGQFSGWGSSIRMSAVESGEYAGYYSVQVQAEEGSTFKFRDADRNDWDNELISPTGTGAEYEPVWHALGNETFPAGTSTVVFDYSDPTRYIWRYCYGQMDSPGTDPVMTLPAVMQAQHDMPVMVIRTLNGQPVTSKEVYQKAVYYLDNRGVAGISSVASDTLPDTLQIKGRGNWTWTGFDKKPYRLKLQNKTGLLGLKKNKHFGLLAHADDWSCWMKNTMGFLLSEQMGMRWTPKQQPVEVVLNGDYIGLYMLTELIRVEKDRVNIVEQPDECTQPDTVTGGWLVEIDNYEEEGQVAFAEPEFQPYHNGHWARFTPKTPEILSAPQRSYLTNAMQSVQNAIYSEEDSTLASLVDIPELAKFYVIQEIMSNRESFNGSCYLHKNIGADSKWFFGPVWDFGNSYDRNGNETIYENESFPQKWIARLMEHENLQEEVIRQWKHWKYYESAQVEAKLTAMKNRISQAAGRDAQRWPQYNHSDVQQGLNEIYGRHTWRVNMLTSEWGEGQADPTTAIIPVQSLPVTKKLLVDGQVYILRGDKIYNVLGK